LLFERTITMSGEITWTINGQALAAEPLFTFDLGDTVRFHLNNQSFSEHPFHLHGQFFTILDALGQPSTTEPGLKDTALIPPYSSVDVVAYLDNEGRWMAHCHILEHAELGMMAEIVVGDDPLDGAPSMHPGH
jgi:FtsP/CotA-like multicopper oxidase with cupredoxin domain